MAPGRTGRRGHDVPADRRLGRLGSDRACTALFGTPRESAWQMEALERALVDVVESASAGGAPSDGPAGLRRCEEVARRASRRHGSGRADFFRGGITVTSMTPLRWVPFRVVCILGMDQAAFGSEGPPAMI